MPTSVGKNEVPAKVGMQVFVFIRETSQNSAMDHTGKYVVVILQVDSSYMYMETGLTSGS